MRNMVILFYVLFSSLICRIIHSQSETDTFEVTNSMEPTENIDFTSSDYEYISTDYDAEDIYSTVDNDTKDKKGIPLINADQAIIPINIIANVANLENLKSPQKILPLLKIATENIANQLIQPTSNEDTSPDVLRVEALLRTTLVDILKLLITTLRRLL